MLTDGRIEDGERGLLLGDGRLQPHLLQFHCDR